MAWLEILTYGFFQKALIAGISISLACALLGVFLVLRRYALLGDGISHIAFGGIALGLLFNVAPYISAVVSAVLGAIAILQLRKKTNLQGDTALGIVSHLGLASGIFVLSFFSGLKVDIVSYLFGNVLAVSSLEVIYSILILLAVLIFVLVYYGELIFISYDEEAARVSGIKVGFLSMMLMILTAITIGLAMRIVGLLLVSSLIILPAASALQVSKSFKKALLSSGIISVLTFAAGLFVSYAFDFSVSGSVVLLNFVVMVGLFSLKGIGVKGN